MADHYVGLDAIIAQVGEGVFLRAVLKMAGDGLVAMDDAHRICYCGPDFASTLGYTPEELLGRYLYDLVPPLIPEIDVVLATGYDDAYVNTMPFVFTHRDGSTVQCSCSERLPLAVDGRTVCTLFKMVPPCYHSEQPMPMDIEAAPLEESNHRVRNNLAIICALLDMEIQQATDCEQDRLLISLARVRALSLVHNLIAGRIQDIDMVALVRGLLEIIRSLYQQPTPVIVHAPEEVYINARRAGNLALALTELYVPLVRCRARDAEHPAVISITRQGNSAYLTIDGSGCEACDPCQFTPLSRDLLAGFVERSLRGKIERLSIAPIDAAFCFPVD